MHSHQNVNPCRFQKHKNKVEFPNPSKSVTGKNYQAKLKQILKDKSESPSNVKNNNNKQKTLKQKMQKAKRTLKVTTQCYSRTNNPEFARNYPTGDRMLRYKKIKEYFFTDTFFATKKGGK